MKISTNLFTVGFMVTNWVRSTLSNTTSATASSGETGGCPANSSWTPTSQSCYLYLQENVNFTQAKGGCEGLGAYLVSISSKEENQFILDFVGATNLPIWIGLFRTTTEICAGVSCGSWMWLDRSDTSYSRWAAGIAANLIQCVFIDSQGDWDHGRECSTQRGYVCEQKRIFPSTTPEYTTIHSMGEITNPTPADPEGNIVSTDFAPGGNDGGGNLGLIVGCVVGGLVLVGIIIAAAYLVKRYRNTSKPDQPTREKDSKSPKRDKPSKKKDRKPSQRDKPKKHKDRKSTPKNPSKSLANDDVQTDRVNGNISRGYSYEDVESGRKNKGFKQTPALSASNTHSGGLNPDQIYAEPMKKKQRPGSEGVVVRENSLYGSGQ